MCVPKHLLNTTVPIILLWNYVSSFDPYLQTEWYDDEQRKRLSVTLLFYSFHYEKVITVFKCVYIRIILSLCFTFWCMFAISTSNNHQICIPYCLDYLKGNLWRLNNVKKTVHYQNLGNKTRKIWELHVDRT